MIEYIFKSECFLPYSFAFLMGLSMLIYSLLDGYDLGVGVLTDNANSHEKDMMINSIGPFWDANETWLILGIGILLVAFPEAHGIILGKLYIPVSIMIFGLIFRGVAFDFRAKAPYQQKWKWNNKFFLGSLLTSLAQGYMLGSYIIGFKTNLSAIIFSSLIAASVLSAYCLIGACWIIMKCEGNLQIKALKWAKYHLINSSLGLIAVSCSTPLMSDRIFNKWFKEPYIYYLLPIPLITAILIFTLFHILKKMPFKEDKYNYIPFCITAFIFILSFFGLAYSFFPYIVPGSLTIIDSASSKESLFVIFIGIIIIMPLLFFYTVLSYYVFRGKVKELRYD